MTKKKAIQLAESGWWKDAVPEAIVSFQLFEQRLCMPFDEFHKAVETVLGRPVWTHEFATPEQLQQEFLKQKPKPTMEDIIALIPSDKRIIFLKLPEGE